MPVKCSAVQPNWGTRGVSNGSGGRGGGYLVGRVDVGVCSEQFLQPALTFASGPVADVTPVR